VPIVTDNKLRQYDYFRTNQMSVPSILYELQKNPYDSSYIIPSSRNFKFDRYRSDIRFEIRYQISQKYADGTSLGIGDKMSRVIRLLYSIIL